MRLPIPPIAGYQIEFQRGVISGRATGRLGGFGMETRPAESRVKHDSGHVDDGAERGQGHLVRDVLGPGHRIRRPSALEKRLPVLFNRYSGRFGPNSIGMADHELRESIHLRDPPQVRHGGRLLRLDGGGTYHGSMLPIPLVVEVPAARFERLSKGINLSHWWAQNADYSIERLRRDVTRDDFDQLFRGGFRHVRLTLDPKALDGDGKTALLKEKLEDAHEAGLAVIVDCHPEDAYKADVKKDPATWIAWWSKLAQDLKDEDPNFTFFEVMNEPTFEDAKAWREVQLKAVQAIRKEARGHTVIVSGHKWSGIPELLEMEPYKEVDNLVYNFHCYDPFVFTHQGATWGWEMTKYLKDLPYPSDPQVLQKPMSKVDNPEVRSVVETYGKERWNAQKVEDNLRRAAEWGRKHRQYLTCNEFGAYKTFAPKESRGVWIRDTRTALEKLRIGWAMWDYQGGFGAFDGNPGNRKGDSNVLSALGLGG
ncbi:hypothetical protein EON81_24170 [bacterium]|nr:MAG: hypothetical protein EON81_24170 [bacterium]